MWVEGGTQTFLGPVFSPSFCKERNHRIMESLRLGKTCKTFKPNCQTSATSTFPTEAPGATSTGFVNTSGMVTAPLPCANALQPFPRENLSQYPT